MTTGPGAAGAAIVTTATMTIDPSSRHSGRRDSGDPESNTRVNKVDTGFAPAARPRNDS